MIVSNVTMFPLIRSQEIEHCEIGCLTKVRKTCIGSLDLDTLVVSFCNS